ncbi:MAG: SxtJ family membrane protein [Bacteroidetes bacterium]|nr:SxtJ family membrane protein [Bacteroidota bacterium]
MLLLEEIRQIKSSKKDLKKFGLTIGTVLLVFGVFLFVREKDSALYWGAAGILLIVLSFAAPVVLKPLNKIWMTFAIILGWVMTRVILTILFYIALTPTGLLAKLFGKDFLDRRIDGTKKSYWQKREKKDFDRQNYERQF